jgi:hypothetical protein
MLTQFKVAFLAFLFVAHVQTENLAINAFNTQLTIVMKTRVNATTISTTGHQQTLAI